MQPIKLTQRFVVVLTLAIATSGAIGWYGLQELGMLSSQAEEPAPPPAPPRQVTALGRLEPADEIIKLSAPLLLDGDRVAELRVAEGDRVVAGQVVAVLGSSDRLAALEQEALARVRVAQANLDRVLAGAKTGEIGSQRAEIGRVVAQVEGDLAQQANGLSRLEAQLNGERLAQQATIRRLMAQLNGDRAAQTATIERLAAEVVHAENELKRYQILYEAGAESASRFDSKRLARDTARKQLTEARILRDRSDRTNQEQLKEAQAQLVRIEQTGAKQLAEARAARQRTDRTGSQQLAEARATLDRIADVRPADVQAARAEWAAARAALARSQTERNQAIVRSPQDGIILKLHTRPGEKIREAGLLDLASTDRMVVIAEIYQSDIAKIQVGQTATITSTGFSGSLSGKVERLGNQVERQAIFNNQPGENLDRRVIQVRIALDPADQAKVAKLSNLQVEVTIALGSRNGLINRSTETQGVPDRSP